MVTDQSNPEEEYPSLGQVVGKNVQRLRLAEGWTQSHAARRIQYASGDWTRSQLASLESGRRADITLSELLFLCSAFGKPAAEFLQGQGRARLSERAFGDLETIRAPLSGLVPRRLARFSALLPPTDGEVRAAKRLGVASARVHVAARILWEGRTLEEERDRRLGDLAATSSSRTAYRGHVTKQLMEELQAELNREEES